MPSPNVPGLSAQPKKKPTKAEVEAAKGCNSINNFFVKKRKPPEQKKRGRPPKQPRGGRRSTNDEAATGTESPTNPAAAAPNSSKRKRGGLKGNNSRGNKKSGNKKSSNATSTAACTKTKKKRTNWAKEHPGYLLKVQQDWDNKTGLALDRNRDPIEDYKIYAKVVGIPPQTLYKYIREPKDKRQAIGNGVGPQKTLLPEETLDVAGDALARADRGNEGKSRKQAVDMIQDMNPELTRKQEIDQLDRRVLPSQSAKGKITKNTVKAQATTTERSQITPESQKEWYDLVNDVYQKAVEKNTGVCRKTGRTFTQLMPHFVLNIDEECLLADEAGNLQIIGAKDRKKHELKCQDSRCSITAVRSGSAAGDTGPTIQTFAAHAGMCRACAALI